MRPVTYDAVQRLNFPEPSVANRPKNLDGNPDPLCPRYPTLSGSELTAWRSIYELVTDRAMRGLGGQRDALASLRRHLRQSPAEFTNKALEIVALVPAAAMEIEVTQANEYAEVHAMVLDAFRLLRHRLGAEPTKWGGKLAEALGRRPEAQMDRSQLKGILVNALHGMVYAQDLLSADEVQKNMDAFYEIMSKKLGFKEQSIVVEKMLLIGHRVPYAFQLANKWLASGLKGAPQEFRERIPLVQTYVGHTADIPRAQQSVLFQLVCKLVDNLTKDEMLNMKDELDRMKQGKAIKALPEYAAANTALLQRLNSSASRA